MKAAKFFVFGFLRGLRDGPEQDKRCARQKYKDGFQKTFGRVYGELLCKLLRFFQKAQALA